MKKLTKALALVMAMVMVFGVSVSAVDLPGDLTGLPVLGTGAQGTIEMDEEIWYSFTPTQDGYYLFPTTGGYDNGAGGQYDYLRVLGTGFDADGDFKWKTPLYKQGVTYYVRVLAYGSSDTTVTTANFTVTPKRYQYAEPLKSTTAAFVYGPFYKVADLLEGSPYTLDDVDYWGARGALRSRVSFDQVYLDNNYNPEGYVDFYFSDGTYAVVSNSASATANTNPFDLFIAFFDKLFAIPVLGTVLSVLLLPAYWLARLFALMYVLVA